MTGADIRLRLSGGPVPGPCSRYAFLPEEDKPVYMAVREAMLMCRTSAPIPFTITPESIQRVLNSVKWDEPMLYYIDVNSYRYTRNLLRSKVEWNLRFTKDEISALDHRICRDISRIRIPDGDMFRRELYLHNALLDWDMYYDMEDKADWQNHCIIGPILNKRGVCEGFAKLFMLFCRRERIPCMCMSGDSVSSSGPRGGHVWNIVNLGGVHAHVDLTWDLNLSRADERCYDYLNLSDAQLARDHTWDRSIAPVCNSDRFSAFHQRGCDFYSRASWIDFLKSIDGDRQKKVFARLHFPLKPQHLSDDLSQHLIQRLHRPISYSRNEDQNVVKVTLK